MSDKLVRSLENEVRCRNARFSAYRDLHGTPVQGKWTYEETDYEYLGADITYALWLSCALCGVQSWGSLARISLATLLSVSPDARVSFFQAWECRVLDAAQGSGCMHLEALRGADSLEVETAVALALLEGVG